MSNVDDDEVVKKGRFKPVGVLVGLLLVGGAVGTAYLATRSSAEKLTVEQVTNIKKDIYVLPRAEQIPKWRQLAENDNVKLQEEALTQLFYLEDKEAAALAAKALAHVDHRVRGMAAQVVAAIGLPDAEPARAALVKAFDESNASDKPQIAWALTVLNEKAKFQSILAVYKAGQLAAVERLGGGRAFDVEIFAKMATPDEWAASAGDENVGLRQMVASVLSKTGDKKYTEQLIKLVNDKEISVAREAANGLGKIGDPAALKPLLDALSRAGKDERQAFLEALRDGIGGEGLVLALGSVTKETPERTKWQTKQIFDMLKTLSDPRSANALVKYLETKPAIHWQTEAALRLAEVGDVRAASYLGERLKLDPTKIYDKTKDPEWTRDDGERVVSARMLADLAVLHVDKQAELRAKAEDGAMFWSKDRPQPHANALRFLVAAGSKKIVDELRSWSNPKEPLPKEGANGAFPMPYETAPSALRYLGWAKDETSWSLLERQLTRKEAKYDTTEQGMVGAGISMIGMVLRGLSVGSAQGYAQWGDRKAVPILLKFVEDEKQNEGAREEACKALAWVANDDDMKTVLAKAKAASSTDPKKQFIRGCLMESIIRHPVRGVAPELLAMLTKDYDMAVRHQVARAIGWPGLDAATEQALFEKMKDPLLMNDAALALLLGGSEESAGRAVAMFGAVPSEQLDDLKDLYFNSFGYWSDEDLRQGRIFRWVRNAQGIARVRVRDSAQEWGKLRLGAQFNNLEFDNGPHSMTRVVLRYRLIELAKKGDVDAKKGAIETLKFMQEQGSLMALREEKGDTGEIARKALFELFNPKAVVGEKVPEAKKSTGDGVNVLPPR